MLRVTRVRHTVRGTGVHPAQNLATCGLQELHKRSARRKTGTSIADMTTRAAASSVSKTTKDWIAIRKDWIQDEILRAYSFLYISTFAEVLTTRSRSTAYVSAIRTYSRTTGAPRRG